MNSIFRVTLRNQFIISTTITTTSNINKCQYHSSIFVSMAEKSFGGKSIKDKPMRKEKIVGPKKERSEGELEDMNKNRKERELKKKEIRQKQIELQKKKVEKQIKTNKKETQVIKNKKSMKNNDDDDDLYM